VSENLPDRPNSDILLYQTEDGETRIQVRLDKETVWITQAAMAELFQTTKQNVSLHLRNIYGEGELQRELTVKEYLTVRNEGKRAVQRALEHFNLEAIIAVGYRVRSHRGTQFRRWATEHLREYVVKGFVMDDERFKEAGGDAYFDELLARIRDIRSSEKVFWRKVLDIYATSIDYDPNTGLSRQFFASVQNKMHWAVHGHTAAEIIARRADASQPNMGLTAWTGSRPTVQDIEIAKNYLEKGELDELNRIVMIYLEFAELRALNRTPMYMRDWIAKLDEFLKISGRQILAHSGEISHEEALDKARAEYVKYRKANLMEASPVERHFLKAVEELGKIEKDKRNTEDIKRKDASEE